jgi:L-alanine-DL-glutamate epimerase-like enolase superfamily enzyme
MRDANLQLYPLEVPMATPINMAGETLTRAQTLLVKITDGQGREGGGEASSAQLMTGETLGSISASTQYRASRLTGASIGQSPDIAGLPDAILYGNPSAKSCIETAPMDLLGQGFDVRTSTPDQLGTYIQAEITKWAPIVKVSGVKPD